jgi:hypothetical protein
LLEKELLRQKLLEKELLRRDALLLKQYIDGRAAVFNVLTSNIGVSYQIDPSPLD